MLIDLLIVHKLANRSTRPNHIDWADSTLTLITGPNKCYKLTKEKKKKLKINNENNEFCFFDNPDVAVGLRGKVYKL